jgi:DNA-binding CsgD family transcriptional regulator
MSKADALRVQDVRDAFRFIGDCRDLGGDPASWQRRALEAARKLSGGFAATGGEGVWSRPMHAPRPMTSCDIGFSGSARDRFLAYMAANGVAADPIFQRIQHIPGHIVTRTRRELVPDRDWYCSASFNAYRRLGGCDHQLTSICRTTEHGGISTLCVHRELGARDFSPRERRLLGFFHVELGRLVGGALVSGTEPGPERLSPRLRQTLACLLEGDSEKQVALRLGLSPTTAHQYVTMLYRRFGVRSRSQLMVYVFKRLRHGQWPPLLSGTAAETDPDADPS